MLSHLDTTDNTQINFIKVDINFFFLNLIKSNLQISLSLFQKDGFDYK